MKLLFACMMDVALFYMWAFNQESQWLLITVYVCTLMTILMAIEDNK